ncbi:MAG TPA: hypothetical protein HA272_06950 [Methanoregula sp.]|nr:hypothetical protein [Methanoregula sp.]
MDDLFWKAAYLVLFVLWLGIRGYNRRDAVRQETKEKVGWGPDSLFLALNFIGMTFLPVITVLLPYFDLFAFPARIRSVSPSLSSSRSTSGSLLQHTAISGRTGRGPLRSGRNTT